MDSPSNPSPGVVTVWSDIGCPWATLALHRLRETAGESGVLIDHRAFPLELFNRQSTPKYIVDAEIVAVMGVYPRVGWRAWPGPEAEYPVTTLPAMEAVQAAKAPEVGGLRGSDELDAGLRRAFYVEGRCISVHSVVLDVARECANVNAEALEVEMARGAGRAEVYAQWRRASEDDVQGSPHLFTAGGYAVHNPGVDYHWTAPPTEGGFPRFESYDPGWVDGLLKELRQR